MYNCAIQLMMCIVPAIVSGQCNNLFKDAVQVHSHFTYNVLL